LGLLGLYALVAVLISSWLRRRIPHPTWRALHVASFAAFVLITLHGLLAGADTAQPWMRAVYTGAAASIAFLILMRVLVARGTLRPAVVPDADSDTVVLPVAQSQTSDH